jgi:protein SCO1/2
MKFFSNRILGAVLSVSILLSLGVVAAGPAQAHSLDELEQDLLAKEKYVQIVDTPAPDFTLRNAQGEVVRLTDLRGKVVVLWFIYQGCPDVCPLHSEAMAGVQAMVNRTPMRDIVEFVSITTDPAHDLPDSFADYGAARGLDSANWTMLTSGPDAPDVTRDLAQHYGMKFTQQGDGYQLHGVVTHLIDKSGRLRARYHGLKFDPTHMLVHINAFSNDDH